MSVNREGLVPVGRLEALLDKYRRDHGGHYDSTLLRAQDGADLARALRVLLAEAREEGKPLVCGNCGSTVRPGDYERINANPPTPAGTEGPGLGSEERFICHMICCGLDDGYIAFATWDDADKFRESYTSGVAVAKHGYSAAPDESGHKRAVIVSQGPWSDPLGVWRSALAALPVEGEK